MFTSKQTNATPIELIHSTHWRAWVEKQTAFDQAQLKHTADGFIKLIDAKGALKKIVICLENFADKWALAQYPMSLPEGSYHIHSKLKEAERQALALGWGLGSYQFTKYKKANRKPATLVLANDKIGKRVRDMVTSISHVRDLVNIPSSDMTPKHLASFAKSVAKKHNATCKVLSGKTIETDFPAIYAVGKSGETPPCLIELNWGKKTHRKVTLVGKGICFDAGGLDMKSAAGMSNMKKDMGGAAHVLGLANLIMSQNLPIQLRVLVSAAENLVDATSFRPGDVINTRKGLTVEIGNTDAEGRLVLSDALTYACEQKPDLLIDFATLTGAARVALGTEIATFMSNDDTLASDLMKASEKMQDPCWRLPLYQPYENWLFSDIADTNNCSSQPFAGSITAGLFLQKFIDKKTPWLHLDIYAWNKEAKPGRFIGGEATGLLAVFELLL